MANSLVQKRASEDELRLSTLEIMKIQKSTEMLSVRKN